ncbi:MAG: hypothetical protein ACP5UB_10855, partial [Candidatus Sumerlaeaceae bacterium]
MTLMQLNITTLRLLLCALLTVQCFAAPANVFQNPPYAVDRLLVLEGEKLAHGAKFNGARYVPSRKHIELADRVLTATIELPPIRTEFPFNEAIPSWNGWAPPRGGWRVWMRTGNARGWTPWFEAGSWGVATDDATTRVAEFPQGKYDIDSLLLSEPMDQVQVQFELVREMASEPSPTVRLFALSYSSTLGDKALWKQKAEFKT